MNAGYDDEEACARRPHEHPGLTKWISHVESLGPGVDQALEESGAIERYHTTLLSARTEKHAVPNMRASRMEHAPLPPPMRGGVDFEREQFVASARARACVPEVELVGALQAGRFPRGARGTIAEVERVLGATEPFRYYAEYGAVDGVPLAIYVYRVHREVEVLFVALFTSIDAAPAADAVDPLLSPALVLHADRIQWFAFTCACRPGRSDVVTY